VGKALAVVGVVLTGFVTALLVRNARTAR